MSKFKKGDIIAFKWYHINPEYFWLLYIVKIKDNKLDYIAFNDLYYIGHNEMIDEDYILITDFFREEL